MDKNSKLVAFLLLVLIGITYFYGVHYLPFRGEEANRVLTAYEMVYFHNFFNPTHLGEPYYNKPPLFMWLVALFSSLLGWFQEVARSVSVLSTFLTAALIFGFVKRFFKKDENLPLLSALIFLTLGDLLFFYGFLAEIDAFLTFLFFLGFVLLYFSLLERRDLLAFTLAGLFTALMFLTKGFPAFYHVPVTFLILLIYFKRWKKIFSFNLLGGLTALLIPLAVWFANLKNPTVYLQTLWNESFNRTPLAENRHLLKHLLLYPLLNLKQLLPYSFLSFFSVFKKKFAASRELLLILALIGGNYLPYLISPGARGRYILIIFPFFAVLFAKLLQNLELLFVKNSLTRFLKVLFLTVLGLDLFLFWKHFEFFEFYGPYSFAVIFTILTLIGLFLWRRLDNFGFLIVLLLALKVVYVNYVAPLREKSHPERRIVLDFKPFLGPPSEKPTVVTYLPQSINMELCAYLDISTNGIVLRKKGPYFVTTESQLPREPYKILKTSHGWVLGVFK